MNGPELSGARKAAVLLLQLGPERAARVLQSLDDDEIEAVVAEITALEEVDDSAGTAVLAELVQRLDRRAAPSAPGRAFARKVLSSGLDPQRASQLIDRIGTAPFRELLELPVEQAVGALAPEHPQAVAVVLSSLPADRSLALLQAFPEERRGDVAFRMAAMEPPTPEAVNALRSGLAKRLSAASRPDGARRGRERSAALVEMLQRADAELEAEILAQIQQLDPALAAEINHKLFSFEDLAKLPDKALQLVVREVDAKVLALALKGASESLREKLFANMSERAGAMVSEESELLGAQRRSDVEVARTEVLAAMRSLEEAGKITVARGDDSLVA